MNLFKLLGTGIVNGLTSHQSSLSRNIGNKQAQPGHEASQKMMAADAKRARKAAKRKNNGSAK